MNGDEDYLFDGFDVINKLNLIQNRRRNDNGNKAQNFKYSRRNESDSSSEGENGKEEKIDNWKFDIIFILIFKIIKKK